MCSLNRYKKKKKENKFGCERKITLFYLNFSSIATLKSESLVSRVSELQKLLGLFINMRSIVLGFSGFLKNVGFIEFLRRYKLEKSFKFVSVISELKSPSGAPVRSPTPAAMVHVRTQHDARLMACLFYCMDTVFVK